MAKAQRTVRLLIGDIGELPAADTKTVHEIDVWENRWFPIAQASLTRRFPAVAAKFFQNLSQMSGPEVAISVQLFVDRYDALAEEVKSGPEAPRPRTCSWSAGSRRPSSTRRAR